MASTSDVPLPSGAPAPGDGEPPTRPGALVGLILGGLVAVTLGMATFIWYRWQAVREPTTAVIVAGDPSLEGTIITVSSADRDITTTLGAANDYVAPVLLEPGWYYVTAERNGQVLLPRQEVEVRRFLGVRIDLAELLRPTTAPAPTRGNLP